MDHEVVRHGDPTLLDLVLPALPSCDEVGDGDAVPTGGAHETALHCRGGVNVTQVVNARALAREG
eukprot:2320867-Pyramimonas_sp.AAC.1